MKIFHLSDLHLGLKLINKDLSEDQAYILDSIVTLAGRERPDAVVIAGDIYDRAIPPAEAVTLFDRFVTRLTETIPEAAIMIISGNHDSADRVNAFRDLLKRGGIHMIGLPPMSREEHIEKVVLSDEYGPVNVYLLPFVKPSWVKDIVGVRPDGLLLSYDESLRRLIARENIDVRERNVLVSHQFYLPLGEKADDVERADSEIVTVGNIDAVGADCLAPFDYAALGHIHKRMTVGNEAFRYCGTPLACSVSEAGQEKGILEVTLGEKGCVTTRVLPLIPLREIRRITGTLEEILGRACDDYVTAELTDADSANMIDGRDRLRSAFPNLLEIRYVSRRDTAEKTASCPDVPMDAYALCRAFLGDMSEEDSALLQDVINTVKEKSI